MIHIISYTLNSPGQNYKKLSEAIESAGSWCRPTTSTYIIDSPSGALEWFNYLKPFIDTNDHLSVVEITSRIVHGYLDTQVITWLRQRGLCLSVSGPLTHYPSGVYRGHILAAKRTSGEAMATAVICDAWLFARQHHSRRFVGEAIQMIPIPLL